MFGAKTLAREALNRADQALQQVSQHVKDCVEQGKVAAEWRGEVKAVLKEQNEDLEGIKSFLSKILLTALGTLLVVVATLIWAGVKGLHP